MPLDLIPPELIRKILHKVDLYDPDSREGLRHFSRCSGRYHLLTQPFLYSILIQSHTHAVPLFLRSILANPSLADYTREFKSSAFTAPFAYNISSIMSQSQRMELERSICSACDNDEIFADKWIDTIFNNTDNYDAVTAITICLVPNLESLQIFSYGLPGGNPYVQHVLKRAAMLQEKTARVSPYRLETLSSVSLSYHDDQEPELDFLEALCFIRPPSVQTFFCKGLASDNGGMDFKSHVREITFDNFAVLDLTPGHILNSCVALRSFKYTSSRPYNPIPYTYGLEPSRETLEQVVLRGDLLASRFSPTNWSKFRRLEHLDVSSYALTEPLQEADEDETEDGENKLQARYQEVTSEFLQRLPPSLKFLRMSSCPDRPGISPFVTALVMSKEIYTPSLEEVVLVPAHSIHRAGEPKRQKFREKKLVKLCQSFGVRLIWEVSDLERG